MASISSFQTFKRPPSTPLRRRLHKCRLVCSVATCSSYTRRAVATVELQRRSRPGDLSEGHGVKLRKTDPRPPLRNAASVCATSPRVEFESLHQAPFGGTPVVLWQDFPDLEFACEALRGSDVRVGNAGYVR